MQGALLRSGKSERFSALGETGQPVFRSALQLRESIRREARKRKSQEPDFPHMELHLAIPQSDQQGERLDWYSGMEGDVIPWSAASEEERAPARQELRHFETFLESFSDSSLAKAEGTHNDRGVLAKLLKQVIRIPDQDYVYLVNGTPVLTFWGFEHPDAKRTTDPLHFLYPQDTAPAPAPGPNPEVPLAGTPSTEPVIEQKSVLEERRPWWRRWWPLALLLLLLLLLLTFFGLRSCTPQANLPEVGTGNLQAPDFQTSDVSLNNLNMPTLPTLNFPAISLPDLSNPHWWGGASNGGAGSSGMALDGSGAGVPEADLPEIQAPDLGLEASVPEVTALPEMGGAASELPVEENLTASPVAPPELGQGTPPANSEASPSTTFEPLTIPPQAEDGPADFMNGNWRAAGVMDSETGRPLRVSYAFEKGQGQVQLRHAGDQGGVTCTGPIEAAMQEGALSIQSQGQASCEDGSFYDMPEVLCEQGATDMADCAVSYANETFPMQMWKDNE
ncbi:SrfA family protein [Vreelandella sedimenti]|uniref:SrfA family protein n=1 Tax=Vreelandella sedimenti TaxID=2729618 RepID=UPI00257B1859|nr:SrfA family protein [Halomonas sp. UBA3173]|tara:strand:+ start:58127 stop:59641 length:1515 start_codon:yes stop_codon:yes gene_type:complete